MLKDFITRNDATIQSQSASIKNLENQVGQLADAMRSRPVGTLPSNTENPRGEGKEQIKAIALRNGKAVDEPDHIKDYHKMKESEGQNEVEQVVVEEEIGEQQVDKQTKSPEQNAAVRKQHSQPADKASRPPPPFPQRLHKQQDDKQFKRFMDVLKQLHINVPLVEALEQMPSYAKFMKDILSRKKGVKEYETVALTQESNRFLNKLPPKLKDPGIFTIPCSIGNTYVGQALCDLGASINLMPKSIFTKLGIGEARPTTVTLQLADRSITYPEGIIEYVLVRVDKFIFPADFIVLAFEADREVPLLLGRPFLATGRTLIDVEKGALTMRVNNEQITFNVLNALKYPSQKKECAAIKDADEELLQQQETEIEKEPLEVAIAEEGAIDEEEVEACLAWIDAQPVMPFRARHFESLNLPGRKTQPPKPSAEEPPVLELKPLPDHLRYAYLEKK
ncbi:uncharacterized protein LOC133296396 [Gastrolobium bilobum]|uniref:uncharacterized protein LOC133296396 n=1 Tax=Gastrolobium bilobum TaxID=150636 RepID=UPI002AB2E192|nr:uncharacterized protein LOC133296396 [Gastrolobium bilobum]